MTYARRADSNHGAIAQAIREVLGWPVMDLRAQGKGCEDLLVGVPSYSRPPMRAITRSAFWLVVECKVPRNKAGTVQPSQYTKAQKEWRKRTEGWPRITVVSAEDAVAQLRAAQTAE